MEAFPPHVLYTRERFLKLLMDTGLRKGDFTLTSGRKSTYLVDCKPALLLPGGAVLAAKLVLAYTAGFAPQRFAGVELGGCPLATSASVYSDVRGRYDAGIPALYVRKKVKQHGSGNRIEGIYRPQDRVVLLEDVVTTGASSLAAVEALRSADLVVAGIFTLVDRCEGGAEAIAALDIPFTSVYTPKDFGIC